jgi:alkylation response protein AidB-like acyl-CoA dehydrogenase
VHRVFQAVHTDEQYDSMMRQNEAELEAARQRAQQAVQDYNVVKRQMAEMAAGAASAESLTLAFAEWGIDVDDDEFSGVPATDTPGPSLAEEE